MDIATGRVLRFNNTKQKCLRDLFFIAETCALAESGQIHSPPTTTAFQLVTAGIVSPIHWFSQIQSDGQAQLGYRKHTEAWKAFFEQYPESVG